ncbi:phosphopantetheine-binding protein [Gordonia crocea]|uniref:Carrier domain-containing protein n=1 Tax=Gordonia crocea TaxID=589162 RepID=A0A7I9V091_9ACTN|nr:phosphopantetheine-binding protein [Gordonia crocea]GED98563.1 hypothetical protein nbrc107697_26020 [Gordonia crocea]
MLTRAQVLADIADAVFAEVDELSHDTDLVDLGMDSIKLAGLLERWRRAGALVRFADLAENTSVGAWLDFVAAE